MKTTISSTSLLEVRCACIPYHHLFMNSFSVGRFAKFKTRKYARSSTTIINHLILMPLLNVKGEARNRPWCIVQLFRQRKEHHCTEGGRYGQGIMGMS